MVASPTGTMATTMRGGAPSASGGSTTMPPTKVAAVQPDSKPQLPLMRRPSSNSLTFTRGRLLHAAKAAGSAKNSSMNGARQTHR